MKNDGDNLIILFLIAIMTYSALIWPFLAAIGDDATDDLFRGRTRVSRSCRNRGRRRREDNTLYCYSDMQTTLHIQ